jgi:alpha-L-arabinofuranosidase
LTPDRKKLLVSVVNPTEDGQSLALKIGGVKLRGQGKLSQIAPSSFNATNEAGKEPEVKIVETALRSVPDTVQVPPFSVSLYEFEV